MDFATVFGEDALYYSLVSLVATICKLFFVGYIWDLRAESSGSAGLRAEGLQSLYNLLGPA
jgi:hypothetical protein